MRAESTKVQPELDALAFCGFVDSNAGELHNADVQALAEEEALDAPPRRHEKLLPPPPDHEGDDAPEL